MMYLIRLDCSCGIELPFSLAGPKFLPSPNCEHRHNKQSDVRNQHIDQIIAGISILDAEFECQELMGDETFH